MLTNAQNRAGKLFIKVMGNETHKKVIQGVAIKIIKLKNASLKISKKMFFFIRISVLGNKVRFMDVPVFNRGRSRLFRMHF